MKILVTGGTGTVGSKVIDELLKRGANVRALIRDKEASAKIPKGVETAIGNLLDPVSVHKALQNVDKLFLLNAVVPDELTQGLIAFGLARRLKLRHIAGERDPLFRTRYGRLRKRDAEEGAVMGCL